jgi:glycyl-tRNA synthetase beta chain
MTRAPLLVEILCEELPPRSLRKLGDAFANGIVNGLVKRGLVEDVAAKMFATPRRLAVSILDVASESEPRQVEVKLMPVAVALDAAGKPTAALLKKLEAAGLAGTDRAMLRRRMDGKSEMLFADAKSAALPLEQALQGALDEAIAGLPIPKVMSYQLADGETICISCGLHTLVALHGSEVVAVRALGPNPAHDTPSIPGRRDIELANASSHEAALEREGRPRIVRCAPRRHPAAAAGDGRSFSPGFVPRRRSSRR